MCTKKLGAKLVSNEFFVDMCPNLSCPAKKFIGRKPSQKLVTLGKVTAGTFSEDESEVLREMNLKSTKREIRNSWQAF